jgi:hypothetical protein
VFFVLVFLSLRRHGFSWVFVVWCMALLASAVMTIRGATVQPWFCMSLISSTYFVSFCGKLSLQMLFLRIEWLC